MLFEASARKEKNEILCGSVIKATYYFHFDDPFSTDTWLSLSMCCWQRALPLRPAFLSADLPGALTGIPDET